MVRGLERGRYHLTANDVGQQLLIGTMAGLSPRLLPLALHMLLGPLIPLVLAVFGWMADRAARRHNMEHGPPVAGQGAAAGKGRTTEAKA